MSVCECSCDYDEEGMGHERGPHICRTPANCCYCEKSVEIGSRCYDMSWFFAGDPGRGGHAKAHETCRNLREQFADKVCDGCYAWSKWDFDEASQYAVAHGDEPFWRDWLLLYETTWTQTPDAP